jgi:leader peptidase (prepilin peptidase) / N-methyltransferase
VQELLAQSPAALIITALVVGLAVGSFLNVVIYRVPVMLDRQWRADCAELDPALAPTSKATLQPSVASTDPAAPLKAAPFNLMVPRSTCPACKAPIKAWHNIPLLSYVLLRARCANCQAHISARYPAVEALCGLLSALVAWRFGYGPAAACGLIITWFLIALTFIDLDHQLLPDSLTLPLLWLGLLASLAGWANGAQNLPVDPVSAIAGAALGYVSLWAVYHAFRLLTGKEGMGYGDFKLLAALGAWLGWRMLLPIVLLAALVGAVLGIALIAGRRHQRGMPMPFGPFLAAAGWLALMWGPQLVTRYLGLYGAAG